MKIQCLTHYLKNALSLIDKISNKNISLPILSSVLIFSQKKELKLCATNLEIGLELKIPAKIEKEGKIVIPSKLIYGFLSNIPSNENILLEEKNNNLIISTNNSSTTIKGYPVEDFPLIPFIKDTKEFFNLPAKDFISGLNSVSYAASLSEMKPEIASVFINSQKTFSFVATDSFRLARKIIPYNFSNSFYLLIPIRSVMEIIRIFENEEGDIKIFPHKNQIFFFSEKIKFFSRLIEGNFPDYEEIIPKNFTTTVILDKNSFGNNLKIASIFSGKLNEVKIELIPEKKEIKIQTNNGDLGEHTAYLPAEIKGEKIKINFNHKYLNDCLRFIPSDKVVLKFSGENKPVFITDSKDNSFYYLVMPMKDF